MRANLCSDIARLTEDLVQAKLMAAQSQSESEVLQHKLLRSETKCRSVALRMTKLEVSGELGAQPPARQLPSRLALPRVPCATTAPPPSAGPAGRDPGLVGPERDKERRSRAEAGHVEGLSAGGGALTGPSTAAGS